MKVHERVLVYKIRAGCAGCGEVVISMMKSAHSTSQPRTYLVRQQDAFWIALQYQPGADVTNWARLVATELRTVPRSTEDILEHAWTLFTKRLLCCNTTQTDVHETLLQHSLQEAVYHGLPFEPPTLIQGTDELRKASQSYVESPRESRQPLREPPKRPRRPRLSRPSRDSKISQSSDFSMLSDFSIPEEGVPEEEVDISDLSEEEDSSDDESSYRRKPSTGLRFTFKTPK